MNAPQSVERPAANRRSETQQRRVVGQVISSASTLTLLAVVVMVNYLAFRHYKRFDWTSEGMFTLSASSLKVLRDLDADVDVYVFLSQGEPQFGTTDELIRRYKAASPHVRTHQIDPERQEAEFKLLAQRFGVLLGSGANGEVRADVAAIVARGAKNWHVNRDDLLGWDAAGPGEPPGGAGEQLNVKAEQALTGAIVQVVSGRATKVCVTKGHGEWSVEENAERALSSLQRGLRHDNVEWKSVETLGVKQLPGDCDALFVLGPERAFSDAEAKLVLDYVRAGGNAWLGLDPVIDHDQILPTGFEGELKTLGVNLDRSLAVELSPEHLFSTSPLQFGVTSFGDHATTRAFKGRDHIVMVLARSLSVVAPSDRIEVLLRTSDKAFGATDLAHILAEGQAPARQAGDIAGPLDLAFAVQTRADSVDPSGAQKPGGRLIVTGDTDMLQPDFLDSPQHGNLDLARAWTGWLTQRNALIEIAPKKLKGGNIAFNQDSLGSLIIRVAVLLPGAMLLLGIAVWLQRRA